MTPLIIIKLQATHLSVDLSGYNVANSHTLDNNNDHHHNPIKRLGKRG
jgi:hypothetical protein